MENGRPSKCGLNLYFEKKNLKYRFVILHLFFVVVLYLGFSLDIII